MLHSHQTRHTLDALNAPHPLCPMDRHLMLKYIQTALIANNINISSYLVVCPKTIQNNTVILSYL